MSGFSPPPLPHKPNGDKLSKRGGRRGGGEEGREEKVGSKSETYCLHPPNNALYLPSSFSSSSNTYYCA